MRDAAHSLERAAVVAIPARLADEGVAVELARGAGIGAEGADDRQELRRRAAVVLLVQAGEDDIGRGCRLPAEGGGEHDAIVGNMVDIGARIAHPADRAHRERIRDRIVDVAEQFLAVVAAVDRVQFAAGFEIGAFRHEVDEAADRPLAEEHRRGTAHDLYPREIIGVRRDAGVIGEDVAHPVAKLQRVDAADVEAVDARVAAIGIGQNAGGIFHRVADADRPLCLVLVGGDDLDRLRKLGQRRLGLGAGIAGDDDLVAVLIVERSHFVRKRVTPGERGAGEQDEANGFHGWTPNGVKRWCGGLSNESQSH